MTRDTFIRHHKASRWTLPAVFGAVFASLACAYFAAVLCEKSQCARLQYALFFVVWLVLFLGFVFFILKFWDSHQFLMCPACRASPGAFTRVSGMCERCGKTIFDLPVAQPAGTVARVPGLELCFSKVVCPVCGRRLTKSVYAALAKTTGRCGHCGNTVVLPRDAGDPAPMLTRVEFETQCHKAARRAIVAVGSVLGAFWLIGGITRLVLKSLHGRSGIAIGILLGCAFVLWVALFTGAARAVQVRCPHCARRVKYPGLLRATGRCENCGAMVIIAEPETQTP